jgi:uncharacterized SAM-binding protein YcdF (DUF218 family)
MTYLQPVFTILILLAMFSFLGRRSRLKRAAGVVGVAGLFLWAWPPFGWMLSATLEARYPIRRYPAGPAEAIVVLSSGAFWAEDSLPEPLLSEGTYLRCRYAGWLYRNWRAVPVVVTGAGRRGSSAAKLMKRDLEEEGIPSEKVWIEDKATSTYENAVFTASLLRERHIRTVAVVTEAYHMLRAERCFLKQGLTVTPAPCAYRTERFQLDGMHLVPSAKTIEYNDDVLHEWIGIMWYRISGKI